MLKTVTEEPVVQPAFPRLTDRLKANILTFFDNFTYKARRGLVKGMVRKGGLGFVPEYLGGRSESPIEIDFFNRLDLDNCIVYDLGAFQGLMTLFFSNQAKHVIAYEPNPINIKRIEDHIKLNNINNVTLRNVAVADKTSSILLTFDPRYTACGTADTDIRQHLMRADYNLQEVEVEAVTIDHDIRINNLPLPDFVKIDVEGLDLSVLKGMEECMKEVHPSIYIEVHGKGREAKKSNLNDIINYLSDLGYNNFVHVERDSTGDPLAGIGTIGVHYYCTKN